MPGQRLGAPASAWIAGRMPEGDLAVAIAHIAFNLLVTVLAFATMGVVAARMELVERAAAD